MADHASAILRKLFNWHAARSEDFRTPLVKGMNRAASSKDRARARILSDAELRAFWKAAEAFPGAYGYLVRYILLTATRMREASNMRCPEVSGDVWTIPAERHKSKKNFELPLSKTAVELLGAVPEIVGKPGWVFTHDGKRPVGEASHGSSACSMPKCLPTSARMTAKQRWRLGWCTIFAAPPAAS